MSKVLVFFKLVLGFNEQVVTLIANHAASQPAHSRPDPFRRGRLSFAEFPWLRRLAMTLRR
jgi:hypothetical protein